jgi:photosystem II stability/assembly factor-like uncharacterized protein
VATTVTGILRDLSFADANNGIILASESGVTSLFVTTTGGASWVPVSPVLPTPFTASAIALAGSGVVTLAGGTSNSTLSLYRSTDAGQNWLFEQGTTREIADIVMFDPATGVAVGNGIVGRRQ